MLVGTAWTDAIFISIFIGRKQAGAFLQKMAS